MGNIVGCSVEKCANKYKDDTALFNESNCSAAIAAQPAAVYDATTCSSAITAAIAALPPPADWTGVQCATRYPPVYDATTCSTAISAAIAALPAPADWTRQQCANKYPPVIPQPVAWTREQCGTTYGLVPKYNILRNTIINGSAITGGGPGLDSCKRQCDADPNCKSFFINNDTGICLTRSSNETTNTIDRMGTDYYYK